MNSQELSSSIESYIEDSVSQLLKLQESGDLKSSEILNSKIRDIIESYENEDEFLYIPINFGKPQWYQHVRNTPPSVIPPVPDSVLHRETMSYGTVSSRHRRFYRQFISSGTVNEGRYLMSTPDI